MNVDQFLETLYEEGCENDGAVSGRESMRFNITPATGLFLDLVVNDLRPRRILELGTSNGYSTCWLARAASRVGAVVDSVEISVRKSNEAAENLTACGLRKHVNLHAINAAEFLLGCGKQKFDFVFLDSDRSSYLEWADDLVRATQPGLMIVDNAISHADEMFHFREHLTGHHGLSTVVLPIGKGQMVVQ